MSGETLERDSTWVKEDLLIKNAVNFSINESCLNLQQNSQLLVDARAARTYRDELDALRERAIKADKLESDVGRYREQLHKMEFYKAKVEVDAFLYRLEQCILRQTF